MVVEEGFVGWLRGWWLRGELVLSGELVGGVRGLLLSGELVSWESGWLGERLVG